MRLQALLPILPWVMEAAPYKLDMASVALLLSRVRLGPSGIFCSWEGQSLTLLSLLLDAMVPEEVTLPRCLGYLGGPLQTN